MTNTQLRTPILAGGIRSVNFFNGRMLSAEDLSQEKTANKQARRQLGQAIGDGIAYGLEVKETIGKSKKLAPVVTVQAGLAVNRLGQTLELAEDVDVELVGVPKDSTATGTGFFDDCLPLQSLPSVAGAGVYILTIQPAFATDGKAQVSGLGNFDARCNARYQIDGVQLRWFQVPITKAELNDLDHVRNHLAYRCFGANDSKVTSFSANPFGPVVSQYGLLDELRPNCLKDEEVPLAVIYWPLTGGIEFVDMWSVRRRIIQRSADPVWPLLTSDRRMAEGEAMFLQFQDQIADMLFSGLSFTQTTAKQSFEYLPPAGLLPLSTSGATKGFDYSVFFSQMTYRQPIFIEGAQLCPLLQEAFSYPPIETSSKLVVWLYIVRENAQAVLSGSKPPQSYLVFASGHVPYRGEARYDVHHWNFGNFA